MRTPAPSPDATRHRLLEGVLLRLARRPDADTLVVRGGVLLRHWLRPLPRVVEDLDLVAAAPLDAAGAARRVLPVLADGGVPDGVAFDPEFTRVAEILLASGTPGVRVFASGTAGGAEEEFHIDVTFGPPPRPDPVVQELPTAFGTPARVWACRPETVAAQKVQALAHRGALSWRQKDLDDLRLLLARVPMDPAALRGAVAAYAADIGRTGADVRAVFGPSSWWGMKLSAARWLDFTREPRGRDAPRNLAAVAAEVAARLAPVLEGLP